MDFDRRFFFPMGKGEFWDLFFGYRKVYNRNKKSGLTGGMEKKIMKVGMSPNVVAILP